MSGIAPPIVEKNARDGHLHNGHNGYNHDLENSTTNGGNTDYRYDGSAGSVQRFITPGGSPQDNSQPAFPVFHRKFANPSPLGLMAFGATTYVLSMYNVQARGVATPNVIVGLALGYGGLAQLLAGMWEFASGNTFAATAFTSYGAFWFSFAIIYIPWFNILAAYEDAGELESALGIYLSGWFIVTFIFFIGSLRSSIALASLFFFLDLTFLMLFLGFFVSNATTASHLTKAGGGLGIFTAAIAGYIALSGLLTKDTSYFSLPVGELNRRELKKNE